MDIILGAFEIETEDLRVIMTKALRRATGHVPEWVCEEHGR
jgi:hypothetical protein